ncbi:type II toxin-antitoxin system Phd/YefM family antitoxin [Nostoc parmelioides]|uniref:Antitoxin n=1 Tax=Nostoc parmelioides FACHB-3921 TaxID=2692909 RepID=A0ABR8BLT6_9NOSO|nr:type II toxin-antitoxin system Phd/YefM family antitoxin [Nostoc parmelioides]MBD2254182.1 type II toxin-antitoxin system Phd/YefM family antitoxin [Nostoc parmelioides FACHB-3921]
MINPVSATEARAKFPEIINRVEYGKERILIERHGKPVVAVIGLDDLKRLETLEDAIDSAQLREAIAQNAGFTTLEAVIAQHPHE